jgi:hypothetical protein
VRHPVCIAALACVLWHGVLAPLHAAGAVEAELRIPAAETHVLGDPTPLFWRFKNLSSEPLAFMWEGCCRLNGRLTVTAVDRPVTMVPPGQALAHMFAKAERLDPGVGRDFDTFLSDWTQLTASGTYELRGQYTGVLSNQHPQVPKGLGLWREAAQTPPIQVALTSIRDYLAQRAYRCKRRGLEPELQGPARMPPLEPATFTLRIRNPGSTAQSFAWPDGVELWLVDPTGQRVRGAQSNLEGTFEEVRLEPGQTFERAVPLRPELLEGEPFGDYQVFMDLRSTRTDQARVPSNILPLAWSLSRDQVADLLARAAAGPAQGLRNAPLKLLRLYLSDVRGILDDLAPPSLPPGAAALLAQLRLAAWAKPFAPKPGRVEIPVQVNRAGPALQDARLAALLPLLPADPAQAIAALLAVRRHLGWEVGLGLHPSPDARASDIAAALAKFEGARAELSGAVRVPLMETTNLLAVSLECPLILPPADLLVKLAPAPGGLVLTVARPGSGPSPGAGKIPPAAFHLQTFESLPTLEGLQWPKGSRTAQVVVLCDGTLPWAKCLEVLAPLSRMPVLVSLGIENDLSRSR